MRAAAQRFEFAPPPTAGLPKSLGLAILAHALLLAALTWGISWKRDAPMVVAEGGHFVQEWGGPIAAAALAHFGLSAS